MTIRDLTFEDIAQCADLAGVNWGPEAKARARDQMLEMFKGGKHAPHFYVACSEVQPDIVLGFSGFRPSWVMRDAYDLIWIAVLKRAQGIGLGRLLTETRMSEIKRRGGAMVSLVTQKPEFFWRFGFGTIFRLDDGWMLMMNKLSPVRI